MKIKVSVALTACAMLAGCSDSDASEADGMTLVGSRLLVDDVVDACVASYAALKRGGFKLADLQKLGADKGNFRAGKPCEIKSYSHRCVYETTMPHVEGRPILREAHYHKLSGEFIGFQEEICVTMGESIPMTDTHFDAWPFDITQ